MGCVLENVGILVDLTRGEASLGMDLGLFIFYFILFLFIQDFFR